MKHVTQEQLDQQKKISLVNMEGNDWDVKFEGLISRADMARIDRLLSVQFAILQRQRTIDRRTKQLIESAKSEKPKELLNTVVPDSTSNSANIDPVTESINVSAIYKP